MSVLDLQYGNVHECAQYVATISKDAAYLMKSMILLSLHTYLAYTYVYLDISM